MAKAAKDSRPTKLSKALALALACSLAASCTSTNLPVLTASQANSELTTGYLIGAGDQLKVTVFDEDTLTGEYDVGIGGVLAMPLLDPLFVQDKGPIEVAKMIETNLAEGGYVLYPKVSVEILEHRSFFILGEVATPGEYPHNGELTLEQAVAKAGGYTARADKSTVVLRRQAWPESKMVKLGQTALKVAPGDTITVKESFF